MRESKDTHSPEVRQWDARPGRTARRPVIQFPTIDERCTTEPGVDDLLASLEFFLQDRPRALRAVRKRYRSFRVFMLGEIERSCRELDAADREPAA